ncbi:MAG: cytochrome c biogenesis CcdA family protein [Armatimonadota bacterium]
MEQVFGFLTKAVQESVHIALSAAFLWGVMSIILSPCHLASIPLIVGFISEQRDLTARRAFFLSILFAIGVLVSIGIIGVVTAAAGRMMGDVGEAGNYVVAVVFFVVGLHLLGVIPMPFSGADASRVKRRGLLAAFLLGLIFGIALGPCTFAYMAPVMAVSFKVAGENLIYGISLLLFYGLGHCAVIAAAGTSAEVVQSYLDWNEKSGAAKVLRSICGVLVMLGGVYLIWIARR